MSQRGIFNSSVLRTADELARHGNSRKATFPEGGGEKNYAPSGTWLEEKQLDSLLQERMDMLDEQRIVKRSDLLHGEWKPDVRFVTLAKGKGKLCQHMGFHKDRRHFLYPVEAMFLMESSVLQVTYDGCPLSIEQGYTLLLADCIEKYQVYSHLTRLGYTVIMYEKTERVTPYEKKIRLDQHVKPKKCRHSDLLKKTVSGPPESTAKVHVQQETAPLVFPLRSRTPPINENDGVSGAVSSSSKKSLLSCDTALRESETASVSVSSRDKLLESHSGLFPFPNFNPNKITILSRPPSHLLPENVSPAQSTYRLRPQCFQQPSVKKRHFDSRSKTRHRYPPRDARNHYGNYGKKRDRFEDNRKTFSSSKFAKQNTSDLLDLEEYPCAIPKLKVRVNNWKEFKSAVASSLSSDWPVFGDDIQPLVKTTLSTDELHSKISVVKEVDFSSLIDRVTRPDFPLPCCHKIDFDVYLPHLSYKKRQPISPSFRLSVMNSQQPMPSLADIAALKTDEVPSYVAVVDNGEMNFYSVQAVSLCSVKPMS